jgi:hypothetical protein
MNSAPFWWMLKDLCNRMVAGNFLDICIIFTLLNPSLWCFSAVLSQLTVELMPKLWGTDKHLMRIWGIFGSLQNIAHTVSQQYAVYEDIFFSKLKGTPACALLGDFFPSQMWRRAQFTFFLSTFCHCGGSIHHSVSVTWFTVFLHKHYAGWDHYILWLRD